MKYVTHKLNLREAVQYTTQNQIECEDFVFGNDPGKFIVNEKGTLIPLKNGLEPCNYGDWIIKSVANDIFVIEKDTFNKYWEVVK